MIRRLLLAFQFLTVAPIRVRGEVCEKDIAASVIFFPLVGAFQGVATAATALILMRVLPTDAAAGLAVLSLILSNHGFDLDGLADTFDGLAVKSSGDPEKDRERRLSVMKDSAAGAIGVIAVVMAILLKFLLIKTVISGYSAHCAGAQLFLAPVFSKWITVPVMYHAASGRKDGLGKIFIEHTGLKDASLATLLAAVLFALAAFFCFSGPSREAEAAYCGLFCAGAYVLSLLAVKLLTNKFGGLTGDHFGAITEIVEVLFLLMASLGPAG